MTKSVESTVVSIPFQHCVEIAHWAAQNNLHSTETWVMIPNGPLLTYFMLKWPLHARVIMVNASPKMAKFLNEHLK